MGTQGAERREPARASGDPLDPETAGLVDALGRCAFAVTGALTSVGSQHDLSLTQVRVLGILRDRRLRMADLADYLGLERSTLSGLIDRAERRGLLTRARGVEDGRAVEVAMTAAGQELAERVQGEVGFALASLTRRLSGPERTQLAALLEEVAGAASAP